MGEPDNSVCSAKTAAAANPAAGKRCCAPAVGAWIGRFSPSLAGCAWIVAILATVVGGLLLVTADAPVQRFGMAAANMLAPGLALAISLPQVMRLWRHGRTDNAHNCDAQPRLSSAVAVSLGFLLFTIGQCTWYYHDLVFKEAPQSAWAAASYLLGHPFLVMGVLLLPGRRLPDLQRGRVLMDTSMTLAAVATFIWYFLLGPVLLAQGGTPLQKVLVAAYPIADLLVLFCLLLTVARASGAAPPPGTMPLCLGLLVFVVSNVVFGYQSLQRTYVPGTLLDVGWPLAYLLMSLGAAARLSADPAAAAPAAALPRDGDVVASGIASLLPYALAPLVAALVLATLYEPSGGLVVGVYVGAGLILLLLVLRQVLVIRQNARLYVEVSTAYKQLEQSHRSLEAANAALAQSEERFRAATECASDLMYEYDIATGRLEWFGDVDGQLGHAPGAFPRTLAAWEEVIHPDDRQRVTAALARHVEQGERFDVEYRVRGTDGQYRHWVDRGRLVTRARPAGGPASGRMIGVVSDVTEGKRLEALEGERAALRQAVSAMEGVLGVVGHELRTPLAGLRAMSEYLLTDGAVQGVECEQMLSGINEEVVRMAETVNDLLEAARLNSGLAKWNWSRFELGPVCADALDPVRPLVDEQAIRLECDAEPGCVMRGDADAIRRLVMNLVSNARRFTTSGSIRVSARQSVEGEALWVEVSVSDTGAGIPPEIRDRLGEAFALNAGLVGANHVSGTGLGLAICKGIAVAHGGRLSIRSELGKGTTVVARLRADLEAAMTNQGKAAVAGLETSALTRKGR